MNKTVVLKNNFKFLDANLVRHVQQKTLILSAHERAPTEGSLTRYNMTRVDMKNFIFSAGSKSRSIDNAVLGPLPKRLLFTMINNADFND